MTDIAKLKNEINDKISHIEKTAFTVGNTDDEKWLDLYYFGVLHGLMLARDMIKDIETDKAKYKIGTIVWIALVNHDVRKATVRDIFFDSHTMEFSYLLEIDCEDKIQCEYSERYIYESRKALIQAKIDYWLSLLSEEGCQYHVPDGHIYASDKDECRCKICGEFYR